MTTQSAAMRLPLRRCSGKDGGDRSRRNGGFLAAVLMLGVFPVTSRGQIPEPPLAGRPANYSGLVGRFTISTSAEPIRLAVEDPLTLRVVVRGTSVGDDPTRKHLHVVPDSLGDDFYIEPVPEGDRRLDDGAWEFVWRLRPKSIDVDAVPPLALAYFSPQIGRYQTTRSESIPLIVEPRPAVVVEPSRSGPIDSSFLMIDQPTAADPVRGLWIERFLWSTPWFWLGIGLALGSLSLRKYLEQSRESALASPAVRIALAELGQSDVEPEAVVTRYLDARFGLPASQPSRDEIDRLLFRKNVSKDTRRRWRDWYGAAWRHRYARPRGDAAERGRLIAEAAELVRTTEETR